MLDADADTATADERRQRPVTLAELEDLFRRVLSLPTPQRGEHFERLIGRPEVLDAGYTVRERRRTPDRFPERNAEIRQRHRAGESYGQLALAYGLSASGIAKIVQRGRRKSLDAQAASTARNR